MGRGEEELLSPSLSLWVFSSIACLPPITYATTLTTTAEPSPPSTTAVPLLSLQQQHWTTPVHLLKQWPSPPLYLTSFTSFLNPSLVIIAITVMANMALLLSATTLPSCNKQPTLAFNPLLNRADRSSSGGGTLCFAGMRCGRTDFLGFGSSLGLVCHHQRNMLIGKERKERKKVGTRGGTVACAATTVFSPQTLHWVSTIASVILMFSKGTAIQKSFLPPYFALQAPSSVISWIKGDFGHWTSFLGLLVRLFYAIPGEVELPFLSMLLATVAPNQTTNLRGTPAGAITSLVIAGYLAYQHFSKLESLQGAFDQGTIIPTLALITAIAIPCFLLLLF